MKTQYDSKTFQQLTLVLLEFTLSLHTYTIKDHVKIQHNKMAAIDHNMM